MRSNVSSIMFYISKDASGFTGNLPAEHTLLLFLCLIPLNLTAVIGFTHGTCSESSGIPRSLS